MVSAQFYSLQLFVLGAFTSCALLLERYGPRRRQTSSTNGSARTSLKDGLPNGHGREHTPSSPSWKMKGDKDYLDLMWNYLLVYAIVMG